MYDKKERNVLPAGDNDMQPSDVGQCSVSFFCIIWPTAPSKQKVCRGNAEPERKSKMFDSIVNVLKNYTEVPEECISEETNLQEDLDLNSFDVMNIVVDFEDLFNIQIPDEDTRKMLTVRDIIVYLQEKTSR